MTTKEKLHWFILINGLVVAFLVLLPQILLRTPLDGDANGFLPQTLEYAQTGKLVNHLFNPLALFYGINPEDYVTWHGFLMPILIGSLIPIKSYPAIILATGIIEMIVVLIWVKFSLPMVEDVPTMVVIGAATWGLAGWLCGEVGRPEALVSLIVMTALCFTRMKRPWIRAMLLGSAIGLCVATSPQAGIIATALIVCFFAATGSDWREVLGDIVIGGVSATGIFFVCLTFYPYSLADWLNGMALVAQRSIIERHDFTPRITLVAQFVRNNQPLFLPWALFGLSGFFLWGKRICQNQVLRVYFIALFFVVATYALYASRGLLTYNGSPFLPLMIMGALYIYKNISITPLARRFAFASIVMMSLVASIPLLISFAIPTIGAKGMPFQQAHSEVSRLASSSRGLTISSGLFSLLDTNSGVDSIPPVQLFDQNFIGKGDILLVQQIFPYKKTPPHYNHYQLIQSFFIDHPVRFMGVKIANSPLGWNFAIYKRICGPKTAHSNKE
jgi:hypothetical protein